MSRHWKERVDPSKHVDHMSTTWVGGLPRKSPRDNLLEDWAYFVAVTGFTFEFASLEQLRMAREHLQMKTTPSGRLPGVTLEHCWQRWFERLPAGLLRGSKRARVLRALDTAMADFES